MLLHFLVSRAFWLLLGCTLVLGCSDDDPSTPRSGTETNVQGVPCTTDAECGDELRCLSVPDAAADAGKVCQTPSS